MKRLIIGFNVFLLCSCATTSDIDNVEKRVSESQTKVAELDNKIIILEAERTQLIEKLTAIDSNGKSLSSATTQLRAKISDLDLSISSYKSTIKTLTSSTSKNTKNISVVKAQQDSQHKAAVLAVKNNQALRDQANDDIKALEIEYAEKRKKLEENKNKEDDSDQKEGE